MFEQNNLANLPYIIAPNDVHLYDDQLQININVFSFFDYEGKARHPLFINWKLYPRTANLLYRDEHYAPIIDIPRLFQEINKSMSIVIIYAFGDSEVFTKKRLLPNISVFAPVKTSCRLCTCFPLQRVSELISNLNKSVSRSAHRSSSTPTLNRFLS